MFQHIVMLLTFGIASPVLTLVIIIGAVADVVLYMYMIRRFLDNAKTRPDEDRTGGLEAASRLIPRNFVHIYLSIMWLSALFYSAVLLDYAIEGSFLYAYISFPVAILGIAGILTGLARHPRKLFDAVIRLQRRLTLKFKSKSTTSVFPNGVKSAVRSQEDCGDSSKTPETSECSSNAPSSSSSST
jgi:hypothetical protein